MRRLLLIGAAVLLLSATLCAQLFGGPRDDSADPRNLTGDVFDKDDHLVPDAVVYLKNMRSLVVITFITGQDGSYHFNNLSPNINYEVRAEAGGRKSPTRTLSTLDTRKQAHINLTLEK